MKVNNDILREIINYTDNYVDLSVVSEDWRNIVQEKLEDTYLWPIIFPNSNPFVSNPMPDIKLGKLQERDERKVFIDSLENWIYKITGVSEKKEKEKIIDVVLFRNTWENTAKYPAYVLFNKEWRTYLNNVRIRIYKKIPLYKFISEIKEEEDNDEDKGLKLLRSFKWNDQFDEKTMKILKKTKNWICWNPIFDDGEIEGYEFNRQLWFDLEKLYSFITGENCRDPPDFPLYISADSDSKSDKHIRSLIKKYL